MLISSSSRPSTSSVGDRSGDSAAAVVERRHRVPAGRLDAGEQPGRGVAVGRHDHRPRGQRLRRGADAVVRDLGDLDAGADRRRRQDVRQLTRQGLHPLGRQRAAAAQEAAPQQVEHPGGRVQGRVEEDPGEERPQHLLDRGLRQAPAPELLGGAAAAVGKGRPQHVPHGQRRHPRAVAGMARREPGDAAQGGPSVPRPGQPAAAAVGHGDRAAGERARVQRRDVDQPPQRRVRGQQHLEPPVEPEPVDDVGADAAADVVTRLEHGRPDAGPVQGHRRAQPRQAATHDDDLSGHAELPPSARRVPGPAAINRSPGKAAADRWIRAAHRTPGRGTPETVTDRGRCATPSSNEMGELG